jgi:hypothetical protein
MGNIAFNMQIGNMLKAKYSLLLAILPIGLMFTSFGPTWIIAVMLANWLGLPIDGPVKDEEYGTVWLISFLAVGAFLMLAGYISGWLLNALISRHFYKWDKDEVKNVYLKSRVPNEWLKDDQTLIVAESSKMEEWRKKRKHGAFKFVFKNGVCGWGLIMFGIMALGPALISESSIEIRPLLLQALVWAAAGALFGYIIWFSSEKQYQNYNDRKRT